jgi:hypothetical protein
MLTKQQKCEETKRRMLIAAARSAVVDEAGALELELAPVKPKIRRLDDLRKTIRGWYDHEAAGEAFCAYGETYVATVGARGNETVIHDMPSVFEVAGKDKFLAACKLTIGALGELVDPALASAVTSQTQTGSRAISILSIRQAK